MIGRWSAIVGALEEAGDDATPAETMTCQAVLHMHGHLGVTSAHGALGHVVADPSTQLTDQLAVDERVDVAPVAEVIEAEHAGGNPATTVLLPGE